MNSYRYSSDAHRDIEGITVYLFDLNPVAADHFLDALEAACSLLSAHPLIGRLRPELAEELRSFAIGNFLIFYLPAPDRIDVVRVIYGGRDLPGQFH